MKIYVKMIQGVERLFEVESSITGGQLKEMIAKDLNVAACSQRLIFKGKPILDDRTLSSVDIKDNSRIHLMVKKGESSGASSSNEKSEFYTKLNAYLRTQLSAEQSEKVIAEFKKDFESKMKRMNLDDIERFAASNLTEF